MSFDLYPFIKGWKYETVTPQAKRGYMSVGGSPETYEIKNMASLRYMIFAVGGSIDSKYTMITGKIVDEKGRVVAEPIRFSIYELFRGNVATNEFVPFASRYDETSGDYVVMFGAQPGYIVTRENEILRIEATPPAVPVELDKPSTFEYEIGVVYRSYTEEALRSFERIIGGWRSWP